MDVEDAHGYTARTGEVREVVVGTGFVRKDGAVVTEIETVQPLPCIHALVFHHFLVVLHRLHLWRPGAPVVDLRWSNGSVDERGMLKNHHTARGTALADLRYYIDHDRCQQPCLLPEVVGSVRGVVDAGMAVGRKVCVRCRDYYCYY